MAVPSGAKPLILSLVLHTGVTMGDIFKAYDIRGKFGTELTEDIAYRVGRAIVTLLGVDEVVIGRDMRISSPQMLQALAKGVTEQGANVIDIGLVGTDVLYFAVHQLERGAGVMITASHNPPEDNGMKIVREKAIPIGIETGLRDIKALAEKNDFPEPAQKGTIIERDVLDDFVTWVHSFVDVKAIRPMKIVMDASNGMAGKIAPLVFKGLPLEIIPLNFKLDGSFPVHDANPMVEENRRQIMDEVMIQGADLGIAWDGDTDRCFFIDNTGKFVPGDFITGLLAQRVLQDNPGDVVYYDLRASWYVRDSIRKARGVPKMSRVGHAFIKASMREDNAVFAGEISGHYYFRGDDVYVDNGWIPALMMVELVSRRGGRLSQVLADAHSYHISGEINSTVEDKDAVLKKLESVYGKEGNVSHLDGLKIEFDDWWFNVRPSNTEPLLRLNLEAKDTHTMAAKRDEVLRHIRG